MNLIRQITTTGASRRPVLSVVVPVYKCEAILPDVVQRLSQALPSLAEGYELTVRDSAVDNPVKSGKEVSFS